MLGIRKLSMCFMLVFVLVGPGGFSPAVAAGEPFYERWVNRVASEVYSVAWPSASFSGVDFLGTRKHGADTDAVFRLMGRSAFDNSPLWVEVVATFHNGTFRNIRWGNHNAILFPPGATLSLTAAWVKEAVDSSVINGETGYRYVVTNNCDAPVSLAVRYRDMNNNWHSEGWWKIPSHQTSRLADGGKAIKSKSAEWYFYAEVESGPKAGASWEGVYSFTVDGKPVKMRRMEDKSGDNEWSLTCT